MSNPSALATRSTRRRRGMTLVEMMMTVFVMGLVLAPLTAAFGFVLRTQATAADVTMVRLKTEQVIARLKADIRGASAGAYNTIGYPRVKVVAGNTVLTLLEMGMGSQIVWTYSPSTKKLTRQVGIMSGSSLSTTSETFDLEFNDLVLQEVQYKEFLPVEDPTGTGVIIEDPTSNQNQITAIRVRGRTLHRLKPNLTVWKEIDANKDGKFDDDAVGRDLFGRTYRGDDPRWQYIFNAQVAFRNS